MQTVAFTCATTCIAMADDLSRGLFDRFRSLPMSRSAVLAGRTFADLAFAGVTTAAMALTGVLVGWRTDAPVVSVLGAFALLALFAYAFLWIGAVIGLSVRSVEVAQTAGLIWLFPLTFLSNAFVPLETMPEWLQPIAAFNPVSAASAAVRELFGNVPDGYVAPDYWTVAEPGARHGALVPAAPGDLHAPGGCPLPPGGLPLTWPAARGGCPVVIRPRESPRQ